MNTPIVPQSAENRQYKRHAQRAPGVRYGRLVLIERIPVSPNSKQKWRCRCDCGNITVVNDGNLIQGRTRSCGCLMRESQAEMTTKWHELQIKHGLSRTRSYSIWQKMIRRCSDPTDENWKYYGGRGISVCERWHAFENFYEDMGNPPDNLTIDRIDNNRGYEVENCRWATAKEQARNKRNNQWVEFNGRSMLLIDWANEIGVSRQVLEGRLKTGWSLEETLTTPLIRRSELGQSS